MSTHKLLIHPLSTETKFVGGEDFVKYLSDIEFIGSPNERGAYRLGKRFFELLQFDKPHKPLLMSVDNGKVILSEPEEPIFVVELTNYEKPEFLASAYTREPYCRNCKHKIPDFFNIAGEAYEVNLLNPNSFNWKCPECETMLKIHELEWQHTFSIFWYSITVWHIHWKEAIPTGRLLSLLQEYSGQRWSYTYYRF
ncbi:MAG: hypothetical protein AAFR81_12725 [Chloroflexota bacterium]